MANAISLPYSTSSGVYGTTLSSTYEWYVQWYQYPTNTSKVTSSANMKINSIAQKQSAEKRNLPDGYVQLEYIQSSGTQYVDTGFKPNQDTRVTMDFQLLNENGWRALFGARKAVGINQVHFGFWRNESGNFSGCYDSIVTPFNNTRITTNRYIVDANKNTFKIDNETITITSSMFQSAVNMYLFAVNGGGTVETDYMSSMKLYSCKIYDNDTLVRDYVPCMNANGIVGLYDLVNNSFYTNIGTGEFTAPNYSANDNGVNVNISIYSKNAITRTGTSGYTCSTFTFKSQPTILLHNKTLGESVEVYDMALTTTVADNGSGTAVSGSIVHASTLDVTVPSSWFIEENRQWYFTISDLITIVNTGVTHTNTKTFDTFVVDALYNVWVKKSISLPDGYTQLKYIESTGTQYVDTGFIPNQDTRVVASYKMLQPSDSVWYKLWGSGNGSYNNDFSAWTKGTTQIQHYYGTQNIINTNINGGLVNIDANKNNWTYNGILNTYPEQTFACGYSMYIFNINVDNNAAYVNAKMQLFSFKIYDNNILVRNYIPCLNPSNVAGLYDLENGVFYGDASGGTFNYPAISYTPVEYIESTGTQYLDTGISIDANTAELVKVVIDTQFVDINSYSLHGVGWGSSPYYNSFYVGIDGNDKVAYANGRTDMTTSYVYDFMRQTFVYDAPNGKMSVTGFDDVSFEFQNPTEALNFLLFAYNQGTNGIKYNQSKIYSAKLYISETLVRDFIPVLDSNNVACLYDKVSETFFYNKGTGAFTTGSTIGDSIIVPNSNTTLHKAIQIYVKKNGTLFPMTNLYAKVGGAVV